MVKHFASLCIILMLLTLAGCGPIEIEFGQATAAADTSGRACPWSNVPPADIPPGMRSTNYGGGSCMHAAFQDTLKWQDKPDLARIEREQYSGAAGVDDMARECDRFGLDYGLTTSGDVGFLEWCSRTHRAAAIHWDRGAHAVTFCGFDRDAAYVIDNNAPARIQRILKSDFLAKWRVSDGGRAITPVYSPAPPRPWM